MTTRDVAIVRRFEMPDFYMYEVIDEKLHKHVVEISADLLNIEPKDFTRGSDQQHLDILACGAVLLNLTPEATFHRVDREMVDRAYRAAVRLQSFERLNA